MAFTMRFSTVLKLGQSRLLSISCIRHGSVIPFKLSDIGEGIREVTVKEWFVKPGDTVAQFDNICEVQSDKASVTISSRYDGKIKALHYKIDDVALVGDALVDIELDDDAVETVEDEKIIETKEITDAAMKSERILTTPAVRRIATENNINLREVKASGKAGRVLKEDVLAFVESRKEEIGKNNTVQANVQSAEEIVQLKGYEKHMWKTMTQSLDIPHFVYSDECSVTRLLEFRNETKDFLKSQGVSLSFMPFFIKATSKALLEYPRLNSWLDVETQSLRIFKRHNISIAMDTAEGLVVPNIKNIQDLNITEIARELNRLQKLGQKTSLSISELSGGTFTLSNIGVVGGTYMKPVILPPQIVIGALGKIQKLPRFDDDGNVKVANIISISWAADHRVVDGVTMAKFSNLWKYYVENPSHLLI